MYLLLDTATEVNSGHARLAEATTFPNPRGQDMPIAEEAQRYYKSGKPFLKNYLPYWAANFVDRMLILLIPIVGVLIPAIKFAPVLYTYRLKSRIGRWYAQLAAVESRNGRAAGRRSRATSTLSRLDAIEAEIKAARLPNWLREQVYLLRAAIDARARAVGHRRSRRRSRARRDAARWRGPWNARRTGVRYDLRCGPTAAPAIGSDAWLTYDPPPWPACSIPGRRSALASEVRAHLARVEMPRRRGPRGRPRRSSCRMPATSIRGRSPPRRTRALPPDASTIRRVVLFGPTHRVPVRGLALPSVEAFATPLGDVAVDRAAVADRADAAARSSTSDARARVEHSLEVQLPFLQAVLGDFQHRAVRRRRRDGGTRSSEVIDLLWGGAETLIVVSSDLSHYHRYADACRIDRATRRRDPRAVGNARSRAGVRRDADQRPPPGGAAPRARARASRPAQFGRHGGRQGARRRLRVVRVRRTGLEGR